MTRTTRTELDEERLSNIMADLAALAMNLRMNYYDLAATVAILKLHAGRLPDDVIENATTQLEQLRTIANRVQANAIAAQQLLPYARTGDVLEQAGEVVERVERKTK